MDKKFIIERTLFLVLIFAIGIGAGYYVGHVYNSSNKIESVNTTVNNTINSTSAKTINYKINNSVMLPNINIIKGYKIKTSAVLNIYKFTEPDTLTFIKNYTYNNVTGKPNSAIGFLNESLNLTPGFYYFNITVNYTKYDISNYSRIQNIYFNYSYSYYEPVFKNN